MVLSFVKDYICFDDDKKKGFYVTEKSDLFLYLKKVIFLWRGSHSQNNFMLHDLNKTNNNSWSISLFLKSACIKKVRSVSKEDTKSVLYFKKNSDLHLKKM